MANATLLPWAALLEKLPPLPAAAAGSSNTVAGQAAAGSGIGPRGVGYVLGIVKAYTTRVGEGPFACELDDEVGAHLATVGREVGVNTGRARRCGWFDAVLVRQSVAINGIDGIALTKLDVLDGLKTLKICVGYKVDGEVLFESAAICDYLDETIAPRLHPADPVRRAQHRAWIEFASQLLNDIGGLYTAPDELTFERRAGDIEAKLARLEATLGRHDGPYFSGPDFSLVDAAFAPAFRYFDVFERFIDLGVFADKPDLRAWRRVLAERPSVAAAVAPDYPARLEAFLRSRGSHLSRLMPAAA